MKIKKICPICKKEFYLYPSQVKQGIICCSKKCSGINRSGKNNSNYKRGYTVNQWGYKQIYYNGKKVYEHRLIMEKYLNRKLLKGEEVHHINGNKMDNRIENLEILTMKEHKKHHRDPTTGKFVSKVELLKQKERFNMKRELEGQVFAEILNSSIFERLDALEAEISSLKESFNGVESDIDTLAANFTDSGWITLPLASGISAYSEAQLPQYRKIGKIVYIRGGIKGVSKSKTTIATIPAGFRPSRAKSYVQNMSVFGETPCSTRMQIKASGVIEMQYDDYPYEDHENDLWYAIDTYFLTD